MHHASKLTPQNRTAPPHTADEPDRQSDDQKPDYAHHDTYRDLRAAREPAMASERVVARTALRLDRGIRASLEARVVRIGGVAHDVRSRERE